MRIDVAAFAAVTLHWLIAPGYIKKLNRNIPAHLQKLLADVFTVFLTRINVPKEEIDKVTEQIYKRRVQDMFTFIDN